MISIVLSLNGLDLTAVSGSVRDEVAELSAITKSIDTEEKASKGRSTCGQGVTSEGTDATSAHDRTDHRSGGA